MTEYEVTRRPAEADGLLLTSHRTGFDYPIPPNGISVLLDHILSDTLEEISSSHPAMGGIREVLRDYVPPYKVAQMDGWPTVRRLIRGTSLNDSALMDCGAVELIMCMLTVMSDLKECPPTNNQGEQLPQPLRLC